MPASISLTGLSWSTPDGAPLLCDLDLTFGLERTGVVGRNGAGKSTLLRLIAGRLAPSSGRVTVTGTIAMMRQEALERAGETVADLLGVRHALLLIERAERGLATVHEQAEADWTLPARVEAALSRCGLAVDPSTPLAALSGGQRTRAALAALILAQPDFLLLDEPTNNLDRAGRDAVIGLLRDWRAGAVIVSHDRELLEEMDAVVELSARGAARYGGAYSVFRERKARERAAASQELAHAEKAREAAASRAQRAAERKARKDAAGRKSRAKGGQARVVLDFAKNRAEASGGAGARLREARRDAAEEALTAARAKLEVLTPLDMEIAPTGLAGGKTVLSLEHVTGGYDREQPVIEDLSATVTGPERIILAGPNGGGKTTLFNLIAGALKPMRGRVQVGVRWALLDQHVGLLDPEQTLREGFLRLHPGADPQTAHTALARFGFRAADALRRAGELSGGERVRAGLACVLGGAPPPQLLLLDEPTNHLDLDGLEALEAALAAYDGAVVAASHDQGFIDALKPSRVLALKP